MILCLQSLLYLTSVGGDIIGENSQSLIEMLPPVLDDNSNEIETKAIVNDTITTPGNYKLQGYFTQNNFVDLDVNGYVFEWERYEDLGPVADYTYAKLRQWNLSSNPAIFWHPLGTYGQLRSDTLINGKNINSTIFTPVFTANTYIQGKIYFMVMGDVWPSSTNRWTLRIKLELFNPTTKETTFIISTYGRIDDGRYVYQATLPSKILIPVGYRLRATYEVRLDPSTYVSGNQNNVEIRSGSYTYSCSWAINDDNNTFDRSYVFENNIETIGMQLLMYRDSYPTIDIDGFTNNTIYYSSQNATITISSDGLINRYKWDTADFTTFTSPKIVTIPQTVGWHTLIVESVDEYGNINKVIYRIGYSTGLNSVILNSPANNTLVSDGQYLDFSIESSVIYATYEWDKNNIKILLESPYDIYLNQGFTGFHQLTIHYTDSLGTISFEYFFEFDNSAPVITLKGVINGITYPQGKSIDVQITDRSTPLAVQYKWDDNSYTSWTPIDTNLYRTYLPITAGWHNLTVMANDTFGYSATEFFTFNTSLSLLLVQLNNLLNNTYYFGGNDVEVAIYNDNGTVKYFWGNDTPNDALIIDNILTLSGSEGLPDVAGTYTLSFIVFDTQNIERNFKFIFTIDREKPIIMQLTPIPDYNNTRFKTNVVFAFTVSDNLTSIDNLIVLLSLDGAANVTFSAPFEFSLASLGQGAHTLTIYAKDLAGNYFIYFITFIIDTIAPSLAVNIVGLAIDPYDNYYIPANTEVICDISDTDPIYYSYYSWDYTEYIEFTGSFFLPSTEMYSRLRIMTNDSLGNARINTYYLTIDNSAPIVSLLLIANQTKINTDVILQFRVDDISEDTIYIITSKWDIELSEAIRTTSFTVSLLLGHLSKTQATIDIFARDIVGNEINTTYLFYLDFLAPEFVLLDTLNNSYVRGNSLLDFNVLSGDINHFYYKWDNESDYNEAFTPWDIYVPIIDGIHTLYLLLEDDTGLGIYPNRAFVTYIFIVDDMALSLLSPNDLSDNYYYTMFYGETFVFSVDIRDRINGTEIIGLSVNAIKGNEQINLSVYYTQLNATSYEFTIYGSNITFGEYTDIIVQFYQFSGNIQSLTINIKVQRQVGVLLLQSVSNTITYGENISILFKLNENTDTYAQMVTFVSVNGNYQKVYYILIDAEQLIYQVVFKSIDFISQKGTFTFDLYIESNFYYGVLNGTQAISITINPVPIVLKVSVSNLQVIYDNDLVVYASLSRLDGAPIQFVSITFCFYVYYKHNNPMQNFNYTTSTNSDGNATMSFKMTEDMEYVIVKVVYNGGAIYDPINTEFESNILAISGGLSLNMILIIAASALLFVIVLSFVIYRVVRARPFDELMEKVSDEDIEAKTDKVSPGVILSIFDQSKGPIPLIGKHSLESDIYRTRMRIGVENFLLKICDQAYSSLGFEEHDDRRRIGSINLPNEDMVGFIHGVQLPNKTMRGGFENLSLIVLADAEAGGLLLANQEFMFTEIDELIDALKEKRPLLEIEIVLEKIRRRSVIIMLAAIKNAKKDKNELKKYA